MRHLEAIAISMLAAAALCSGCSGKHEPPDDADVFSTSGDADADVDSDADADSGDDADADTDCNACPEDNATQCRGNSACVCVPRSNGCLMWECSPCGADDTTVCGEVDGVWQCVETCTSSCDTEGELRCWEDIVQRCGTNDVSSCLNWQLEESCPSEDLSCVDSGDGPHCE